MTWEGTSTRKVNLKTEKKTQMIWSNVCGRTAGVVSLNIRTKTAIGITGDFWEYEYCRLIGKEYDASTRIRSVECVD